MKVGEASWTGVTQCSKCSEASHYYGSPTEGKLALWADVILHSAASRGRVYHTQCEELFSCGFVLHHMLPVFPLCLQPWWMRHSFLGWSEKEFIKATFFYWIEKKYGVFFFFWGGFVSKQMSDSLIIISTHVCMHELASAFLLSVTHECSTTVHVWMAYSAAFCHIAWCTANERDWRVFICLCLQLYPINSQSVHFHYSGPCVRKAVFAPRLAKHPISNPQCGNVLINT